MSAAFGLARIVYSVRDWHDNVTVRIAYTAGRYSVTMLDNDSGNVLPVARVYLRFTDALAYAGTLLLSGAA